MQFHCLGFLVCMLTFVQGRKVYRADKAACAKVVTACASDLACFWMQVLVNAGQANAATGDAGYEDCLVSASELAKAMGIRADEARPPRVLSKAQSAEELTCTNALERGPADKEWVFNMLWCALSMLHVGERSGLDSVLPG